MVVHLVQVLVDTRVAGGAAELAGGGVAAAVGVGEGVADAVGLGQVRMASICLDLRRFRLSLELRAHVLPL